MAARRYGQYCGVVSALDVVGERWALLIVRDLLVGPRRYTDLRVGLPRIPTNILATRLKELQEAGVIRRVPLPRCGVVYELTDLGRGLEAVVLELGRWGFRSMGEPEPDDVVTADSLTMALRTAFRPAQARTLPPTTYAVHVGPVALRAVVAKDELRVDRLTDELGPVADPDVAVDLAIRCGPEVRDVVAGTLSAADALAGGSVEVLAGDPDLLARFATTFHLDP